MRDYSTAGKRSRAGTMPRSEAIEGKPLPAPQTPEELHASADYMAELLFGLPLNALCLLVQDSGPKTMVTVNDS